MLICHGLMAASSISLHNSAFVTESNFFRVKNSSVPEVPTAGPLATPKSDRSSHTGEQGDKPSAPNSGHTSDSKLFVATNMFYDIAQTASIGAGISVTDRIRTHAGGSTLWFGGNNVTNIRIGGKL